MKRKKGNCTADTCLATWVVIHWFCTDGELFLVARSPNPPLELSAYSHNYNCYRLYSSSLLTQIRLRNVTSPPKNTEGMIKLWRRICFLPHNTDKLFSPHTQANNNKKDLLINGRFIFQIINIPIFFLLEALLKSTKNSTNKNKYISGTTIT